MKKYSKNPWKFVNTLCHPGELVEVKLLSQIRGN